MISFKEYLLSAYCVYNTVGAGEYNHQQANKVTSDSVKCNQENKTG